MNSYLMKTVCRNNLQRKSGKLSKIVRRTTSNAVPGLFQIICVLVRQWLPIETIVISIALSQIAYSSEGYLLLTAL